MFISYKYLDIKDTNTNQYLYEYTLIDSDFAGGGRATSTFELHDVRNAVIQEYSKRNLNVAANLVRLAQYLNKTYGCSFEYIFNSWKGCVPEYEEEMQKYLLLI